MKSILSNIVKSTPGKHLLPLFNVSLIFKYTLLGVVYRGSLLDFCLPLHGLFTPHSYYNALINGYAVLKIDKKEEFSSASLLHQFTSNSLSFLSVLAAPRDWRPL